MSHLVGLLEISQHFRVEPRKQFLLDVSFLLICVEASRFQNLKGMRLNIPQEIFGENPADKVLVDGDHFLL